MQATIDRIEEGIAVLVAFGEEPARIMIPASLLPEGSREGDVLAIGITRDEQATAAAKDRVAARIDRLRDR